MWQTLTDPRRFYRRQTCKTRFCSRREETCSRGRRPRRARRSRGEGGPGLSEAGYNEPLFPREACWWRERRTSQLTYVVVDVGGITFEWTLETNPIPGAFANTHLHARSDRDCVGRHHQTGGRCHRERCESVIAGGRRSRRCDSMSRPEHRIARVRDNRTESGCPDPAHINGLKFADHGKFTSHLAGMRVVGFVSHVQ